VVAALLLYTQGTYASDFGFTIALALGVVALWRRSPWALCFGLVWTLAFLAPLTMSPGPIHRYYLSGAGHALLGGIALAEWLQVLAGWLGRRFAPTVKETVPAAPAVSAIQ
jgi:hypothetical protein